MLGCSLWLLDVLVSTSESLGSRSKLSNLPWMMDSSNPLLITLSFLTAFYIDGVVMSRLVVNA